MNIFRARTLINESAFASVNIDAHQFFGEINESHFNEMSCLLNEPLHEAVMTINYGGDLLVEAALSGDIDKFEILVEGVFKNVTDRIKKFFKDALAYIKGIIERIKLYLNGMTRNVNEWIKNVKPYVDKNLSNSKDFDYEGYKWDIKVIDDVMVKAAKVSDVTEPDKTAADIKRGTDKLKSEIAANKSETDDIDIKALDLPTDAKEYDSEQKEKLKEKLEGILGYKYTEYKESLTKKARGVEKVTIKGFNNMSVGDMLAFIEKSSDKIESIKSSYEKLESKLNKAINTVEGVGDIDISAIKSEDKNRSAIADAISILSSKNSTTLALFKQSLDITNGLKSLAISLTKDATQEFMSTLSKFARFKAKR